MWDDLIVKGLRFAVFVDNLTSVRGIVCIDSVSVCLSLCLSVSVCLSLSLCLCLSLSLGTADAEIKVQSTSVVNGSLVLF